MNLNKFRYINRLISLLLAMCLILSIAVYAENTEDDAAASDSTTTTGEGDASSKETVGVVFAKVAIRKGAKFTEKNVELVEVDAARVPKGAVTEMSDIIGKYSAFALSAGEYVYSAAIAKNRVQDSTANTTYINIADYVKPDLGEDVSADIQQVIEKNPKRTIYFPDGEYLISKSLITYGDPNKTVCFLLADGAVIKATDDWVVEHELDCLISYGAYNGYNEELSPNGALSDVVSAGSYFWIQGGTLDGNGKAGGISLDGGRETLVKGVNIRNVHLGIRINKGVNNKSSDMDIDDVTISCNGAEGSVGIEILGYDNTVTNVRIYNAHKGIAFPRYDHGNSSGISSGGNSLRDIRIVRGSAPYSGSYGVDEDWHANFFYHCYIQDYEVGMRIRGVSNIIDSCTIQGGRYAFETRQAFNGALSTSRVSKNVTLNKSSGSGLQDYLIRN